MIAYGGSRGIRKGRERSHALFRSHPRYKAREVVVDAA